MKSKIKISYLGHLHIMSYTLIITREQYVYRITLNCIHICKTKKLTIYWIGQRMQISDYINIDRPRGLSKKIDGEILCKSNVQVQIHLIEEKDR